MFDVGTRVTAESAARGRAGSMQHVVSTQRLVSPIDAITCLRLIWGRCFIGTFLRVPWYNTSPRRSATIGEFSSRMLLE